MSDHIDVDCSDVLAQDVTVEQAGVALVVLVERTINGRVIAAEALNHREFPLTKLYRHA